MVTLGLMTAQAADTTMTLACQGIAESKFGAKDQPSREPISFGLVLNLTAKTAEGFPVEDLPVKIDANQATILRRCRELRY
jgi:hypothetical protein